MDCIIGYSINKQSKNEVKTIPFTIVSKRTKYLVVNITEVQELYTKNYKTL